jgi:hypothetical protein
MESVEANGGGEEGGVEEDFRRLERRLCEGKKKVRKKCVLLDPAFWFIEP